MRHAFVLCLVAAVCLLPAVAFADVPTLINYQGVLTDAGGAPITAPVNVNFSIFQDPTGGTAGWTETQSVSPDADGRFTVLLGAVNPIPTTMFDWHERYLEVQVSGDTPFPRIRFISVAYAYHAKRSDSASLSFSAAPGSVNADAIIDGTILFSDVAPNGASSGQVMKWNGSAWVASNDETGVGGGGGWVDDGTTVRLETTSDNVGIGTSSPSSKLDVAGDLNVSGKATIGPGHTNTGTNAFVAGANSTASGLAASVSGGQHNTASGQNTTVGGGFVNVASGANSVVGGGVSDTASGEGSTVSGGYNNSALNLYSTIGGGAENRTTANYATVGGGGRQLAAGYASTIGGGGYNYARGSYSVIAGGGGSVEADSNLASGTRSFIGGGRGNLATAELAVVVGGYDNVAAYSGGVICGGNGNSTGVAGVVGGGTANSAAGYYSTISGGSDNDASGEQTTIGGGRANIASGENSTVAGGFTNDATGDYTSVGGGWGNNATDTFATIGGGDGNVATDKNATVGGGSRNNASGWAATIGGGSFNDASGRFSFVGGGLSDSAAGYLSAVGGGTNNRAVGTNSTIGGGWFNYCSGSSATVGGGGRDSATGGLSTIGGGFTNEAHGIYSTVAGGYGNVATGASSAIGGGYDDTASGERAAVPGGYRNVAAGAYSFAGGAFAKARHDGAFVWASGIGSGDFQSTAANQFLIRADGGVGIGTNSPAAALDVYGGIRLNGGANDFEISTELSSDGDPWDAFITSNGISIGNNVGTNRQMFLFTDGATSNIFTVAKSANSGTNWYCAFEVEQDGDVNIPNGRVGIGTETPAGALDVSSTTGAFIVPRMTTAQRDALTAVNGMIIYNTTTNQFNFRENGAWVTK